MFYTFRMCFSFKQHCTLHTGWKKWGVMAACFCLRWPHLLEVCVCTLTKSLSWQLQPCSQTHCFLMYRPALTLLHPSAPTHSPSILCRCDADEGRSWSCSNRPVLPSMLLLSVSGAELQHRPPLSNILRTLIHTPEREGGYLEQHTHHTRTEQSLCMCVLAYSNTIGERENTPPALVCRLPVCSCVCVYVCFASGTMHTTTSVYCK